MDHAPTELSGSAGGRSVLSNEVAKLQNKGEAYQMKNRWLLLSTVVMVASIVMLGITIAAAADQQVIKVGKKGEIVFDQPTQVGDVTLSPGHYVIQHRVSGEDHFVKFVGAKEMQHSGTTMTMPMQMGATTSKEIKCAVEPLNQKVTQTAVHIDLSSGSRKVTRIEVAGENVAHVF